MAGRRRQFGYQLHESTRRGLCRLAFVLLGLAPLLLCLALCVAEFLPSYHRSRASQWESWLSSQLGVTVEIASVENLSPQRYALHGVRFTHPETKGTIGRATKVDVFSAQEQLHVHLQGTEIESRDLAAAWKMTHDWFLCRPALHIKPIVLKMDSLTVHGLAQETRLHHIALHLQPQSEALQLDIRFHSTASIATEQTQSKLAIRRNHQASRLGTTIELNAMSPLPCPLLSGLVPALDRLGSNATFVGSVQLELLASTWSAAVSKAEFQQVDFAQLTRDTSTAMTGIGTIQVERAQLVQDRMRSMLVTANVGPGRINNTFLQAIERHLEFDAREATSGSVALQTFDQAALSLYLDHEGLVIVGQIQDQLGSLATRTTDKWKRENTLELQRIIDVLNPSTAAARNAFAWLPMDEPVERTASSDTLSRTR